ncbi:transmembrane sensor [Mucilaginibacter sp. UYNi724]
MQLKDSDLLRITRHLNEPADEQLGHEIDVWRSESPDNDKAYNELLKVWNLTPGTRVLEQIDVAAAVSRLALELTNHEEYEPEPTITPIRRSALWGWAAGVAAALLVSFAAYLLYSSYNTVNYLTKTTQGAKDSVLLADGSKVYMDVYTTVKYPEEFKGNTRQISFVSGNAFFKIAKNPAKPFLIQMDSVTVKVLGTSFNIHDTKEMVNIDVKTGRVMFFVNDVEKTVLVAGKGAEFNKHNGSLQLFDSVNQNSDSWLTGELIFVDEPLAKVFKKLADQYKVEIDLDTNLSGLGKLNAKFDNSKLEEITGVLVQTYPIVINRLPGKLVIRKAK